MRRCWEYGQEGRTGAAVMPSSWISKLQGPGNDGGRSIPTLESNRSCPIDKCLQEERMLGFSRWNNLVPRQRIIFYGPERPIDSSLWGVWRVMRLKDRHSRAFALRHQQHMMESAKLSRGLGQPAPGSARGALCFKEGLKTSSEEEDCSWQVLITAA